MKTYAAFLRGVSPMNLKMSELERALEHAGFEQVFTLLSSGNVVFAAREQKVTGLERRIEQALARDVGRTFMTFVRPITTLKQMLTADPYSEFRLSRDAKRVVTFLRTRPSAVTLAELELPIMQDGARILAVRDCEVFSAYVPNPRGPVFMTLLEKTFGKDITTRTWDTVRKAAERVA